MNFDSCEKISREEIYVNYDEAQMDTEIIAVDLKGFERRIDAESLSTELRNFWPKWQFEAAELLTYRRELVGRVLDEHLGDFIKPENRRDLDFSVICVAKILELNSVKVRISFFFESN